MVGFDSAKEVHLSSLQYGAAGAISGVVMRVFAQPLDVLKIRFQLQVESMYSKRAKYHGVTQATQTIFKEEGVTAFWKGHVPAQFLCIVFGSAQFISFEWITQVGYSALPEKWSSGHYKPVYHFLCGGISGCLASTASQPFDVVRTRLIAQSEPKLYKSVPDAVKKMYKQEGVTSFYKGLVPTLMEIFPHAGLQFGFYAFFKMIWDKFYMKNMKEGTGAMESLVCGSFSGICSKIIILPLDVVKKRLQVQGFEKARTSFGKVQKYNGVVDCFRQILREEGFQGFMKGFKPCALKGAVSAGLTFFVYEQCCYQMRKWRDS
ncbi:mitochondrial thiamine pyrophosphate carrier-like [Glandiceps talaboti]